MLAIRKKFVLIGDEACGKTSLLIAFTQNIFQQMYVPTDFKIYEAKSVIKQRNFELSLCDTSGHKEYEKDRTQSYLNADIVLMCFSVDSPSSLQSILEKWTPEVQHVYQYVPIMVVATKRDLRKNPVINNDLDEQHPAEIIKSAEGRAMAAKINAFAYLECSAKTNEGVLKVFETATRESSKVRNIKYNKQCSLF